MSVNLGGGIISPGKIMTAKRLIRLILKLREKYGLEIYGAGGGCGLNAGFLVSTVLETMENGIEIAVLDTSAACHMPDVLEMPYRPPLLGGGEPGEKPHTYRLGGPTCLAEMSLATTPSTRR